MSAFTMVLWLLSKERVFVRVYLFVCLCLRLCLCVCIFMCICVFEESVCFVFEIKLACLVILTQTKTMAEDCHWQFECIAKHSGAALSA